MHFGRLQFPFNCPRRAIRWEDIKSVERNKSFFFPGLFFAAPWAATIVVVSSNGDQVLIPFRLSTDQFNTVAEQIETLIDKRIPR